MLLINSLWLVTMIKSVISNNIILFKKEKEKLIFHRLYRFIYLVVVCYVNVFIFFKFSDDFESLSPPSFESCVDCRYTAQFKNPKAKKKNLIYKKTATVACLGL